MDYYQNQEEQKEVGPFVYNFEAAFKDTGRKEYLRKLYETFAQAGFGRSIEMYAMKPKDCVNPRHYISREI
jgi:hypothetical protein